MYTKATYCIDRILEYHHKTASATTVRYYAYSNDSTIARHLPNIIEYIFTSPSKTNKVENTILVEIMKFANEYPAPVNIVVLTRNEDIVRAVQILKMHGYSVLVVIPAFGRGLYRLEDAAGPNAYAWYTWLNPHE